MYTTTSDLWFSRVTFVSLWFMPAGLRFCSTKKHEQGSPYIKNVSDDGGRRFLENS